LLSNLVVKTKHEVFLGDVALVCGIEVLVKVAGFEVHHSVVDIFDQFGELVCLHLSVLRVGDGEPVEVELRTSAGPTYNALHFLEKELSVEIGERLHNFFVSDETTAVFIQVSEKCG